MAFAAPLALAGCDAVLGLGSDTGGLETHGTAQGGGSNGPSDAAPDDGTTGASDGGGVCSPTQPDGGACNSLDANGSLITLQCDAASPPTPTGGNIVDGTYVLVSSTYFGSASGCQAWDNNVGQSSRVTWLVCGSTWQTFQQGIRSGTPEQPLVANETVTISGTQLAFQTTCGSTQSFVKEYDATPTTLTLYTSVGTDVAVFAYQRQ